MRSDKNSYTSGLLAEWRARWHLRLHGFRILESRYITGKNTNRAEIDIIACRKNLLVFCEVKRRPTIESGWDAITTIQTNRLRRAAESYICIHRWTGDARFDVIIVSNDGLHWVRGAI